MYLYLYLPGNTGVRTLVYTRMHTWYQGTKGGRWVQVPGYRGTLLVEVEGAGKLKNEYIHVSVNC